MADPLDVQAYHEAICQALREAFTVFGTVDDYAHVQGKITTPAAFLSLAGIEPDDEGGGDDGTERLVVVLRWELRLVLGVPNRANKVAARRLAAELALWVNRNRFGLTAAPAEFRQADEDRFTPELQHYTPWLVEFEQKAVLGKSVWDPDESAIIPETIYVGYVPNTGPDHVDDYEKLGGNDELPAE